MYSLTLAQSIRTKYYINEYKKILNNKNNLKEINLYNKIRLINIIYRSKN